jgi:beta-lactam-binding protein with PASTA domain
MRGSSCAHGDTRGRAGCSGSGLCALPLGQAAAEQEEIVTRPGIIKRHATEDAPRTAVVDTHPRQGEDRQAGATV